MVEDVKKTTAQCTAKVAVVGVQLGVIQLPCSDLNIINLGVYAFKATRKVYVGETRNIS